MRGGWLITGVVMALAGIVWTLQGLNVAFVPKSFMTAQPLWVVLGVLTMVTGITVSIWAMRRS